MHTHTNAVLHNHFTEFIKALDACMVCSVETFDAYGQLYCSSLTHAISKGT